MPGESTRAYTADGKCIESVPKADGKGMRGVTIRDFSKLHLVPGVTRVMGDTLAKPGLVRWFKTSAIEKAYKVRPNDGEDVATYRDRILDLLEDERDATTDTGKDFHGCFARFFEGKTTKDDAVLFERFLDNLEKYRKDFIGDAEVVCEMGLACATYGGTPDLFTHHGLLADLKTCDLAKLKDPYYEHRLQISAYAPLVVNVTMELPSKYHELYVDRNTQELRVHVWKAEEIEQGYLAFKHTLALWYDQRREYFPNVFANVLLESGI
jgi:hypothetical protein